MKFVIGGEPPELVGNAGVPAFHEISYVERKFTEWCYSHDLRWMYVHKSQVRTSIYEPIYTHTVFMLIGHIVTGDGRSFAEAADDVATFVGEAAGCNWQFQDERPSSDAFGPGFYRLDCVCSHAGVYWARYEDEARDFLIGGVFGAEATSVDGAISFIWEAVAAVVEGGA